MVARRGASTLGCLIPLLLLAVGLYFGIGFAEAYFHFYQFKDAMGQEARFATTRTDDQITSHLSALADSLQLPPGAEVVTLTHSGTGVTISSDYDELIKLPFNKEKVLHFHPSVTSTP
jgi:hypothetical protein